MKFSAHDYQKFAIEHVLKNPYSGLFLDMGLGKTVTTLSAISKLMYDSLEVSKVLIIAPLRVARDTWSDEIEKWEHLNFLRISKILGTPKERLQALKKSADIYITNVDSVRWLVNYMGSGFDFDMIVIDELSMFKDHKTFRFKALKAIRSKVSRMVGLTGTPAPNGLIGLWSEMYLLDLGERLGKSISSYRLAYFRPDKINGPVVYSYKALPSSEDIIFRKIEDICISMKSSDYLKMPEITYNNISLKFDEKTEFRYRTFEEDLILEFMDSEEITAVNAAVLNNKLLQFANGAVYDDNKDYKEIHSLKLDALADIIESSSGKPVLVFYSFKHDYERIVQRFSKHNPQKLDSSDSIKKWNDGEVPLLLAHPKSAGHGLNLQSGGSIIIWFGLNWSLELYQQANARLYRQGQDKPVIIHHLLMEGTLDFDVATALQRKSAGQEALLEALKARVRKYKKQLEYAQ